MTCGGIGWNDMSWDRFVREIDISKRKRRRESKGGRGEELKNINSCSSCRNDNSESTS